MSISETQNQDSTTTIIIGDDTEVIDDIPDWEGLFTEYGHYGEPAGHNYTRYPVCGAEALDGKTPTASYQPACRYE